jgi:hypothetical protein
MYNQLKNTGNYYIKMFQFLKLSFGIVNKSHIVYIHKLPGKYVIRMTSNDIEGFILFSTGNLKTNPYIYEICEQEYKADYDTVSKFIENIN